MKLPNPVAMVRNRLNREKLYCTAEYWDEKALKSEGDAASMWNNNHLNALYYEEIAEAYARHVPSFRGRKVLEIGCGTGRNTRFLVDQGAEVVGIDFSERALERARGRFDRDCPVFRHQSLFELNDEREFDIVLSWGTITMACSSVEQLADVLVRVRRALKPGGHCLLLEPIHKGPLHRVLALGEQEFIQVLKESGFRIDNVHHMHFWPARLLLAYVPWPAAVTRPLYRAGQWCLEEVLRNRAGGDYQAIFAAAQSG